MHPCSSMLYDQCMLLLHVTYNSRPESVHGLLDLDVGLLVPRTWCYACCVLTAQARDCCCYRQRATMPGRRVMADFVLREIRNPGGQEEIPRSGRSAHDLAAQRSNRAIAMHNGMQCMMCMPQSPSALHTGRMPVRCPAHWGCGDANTRAAAHPHRRQCWTMAHTSTFSSSTRALL
jgi:hypothetical protein